MIWSYKNKDNFELENISLSRLTNFKWFLKGENSEKIVLKSFKQLQRSYLNYSNNHPNSYLLMLPNNKNNKFFQDYYFIMTAMNGSHALRPHNRKFYYNSFTDKFEPIYYDGDLILDSSLWYRFGQITDDLKFFDKNFFFSKINLFKTDNFKNEILKSFKQRVLNFDNRLELFFTESIKNIIKNSEKLHELINKTHSSNKEVASIEKPKKEVISDYIQQVKKHDVNQKI